MTEHQAMVDAAALAHPNEACGVIIGGVVHQVANTAADPVNHYAMDLVQLDELIDQYGYPEATWHSHPSGSREPSEDDINFQPHGLDLLIIADGEVYAFSP